MNLTMPCITPIAVAVLLGSQQAPAPAEPPTPAPIAATASADVNALLDAIEKEGAELRDLQCAVIFESVDKLIDETQRRFGKIVLEGSGANRRFAIDFDQIIVDDKGQALRERYVYADGWLTEIQFNNKSIIKRQIAEKDTAFDPLKLGEGPFPLPIGQKKDEVLKQFSASTCEPPATWIFQPVKDVSGLKLVPKPGTPLAKDYSEIELFYAKPDASLRAIHLIEPSGNTKSVRLDKVQRNAALSEEQRQMLQHPDLTKPEWSSGQWSIDVRPLKPAPTKPAATQ